MLICSHPLVCISRWAASTNASRRTVWTARFKVRAIAAHYNRPTVGLLIGFSLSRLAGEGRGEGLSGLLVPLQPRLEREQRPELLAVVPPPFQMLVDQPLDHRRL